jgi:hypothetical protein
VLGVTIKVKQVHNMVVPLL